jgi:predicted RND superfamily exporter protein
MLKRVFPFVNSFKYVILGVASIALAFCFYGMFKLNVDTNVKSMFPKEAKIRTDIDIVDRNMMGSQTLAVYLDLGSEYAFHDPFVLNKLDALQKLIETKYSKNVVRTLSLVNVAKRSYQVLNDEKEEKFVVPETRQILSNTLFMFDNSNPGQRRKMVSDDFSKAHITVYLRNGGSHEYTQVFEGLQKDIDAMTLDLKKNYPQTKATVTGLFTLVMQGSDYVSWNALSSFGWAVVGISVILLLIFGTLKAGLISVAANAIPVMLAFGIMGLSGVPLDFTTVLIAPIVIGLAVDDTVHFLTHYRHELGVLGSPERAVEATLLEAGQSVTYTSLILALGLGVLAFSSGPGNANVGIYGALAVIVGWICELLLTPSLILVFDLKFPENGKVQS